MPAKRKMKGSRLGQAWVCVCCGESVPWFLAPRDSGPEPDVCVACQCGSCIDDGMRLQPHLGACGKRLSRCDAYLRKAPLKESAASIAARNRAWSALVREYGLQDLHVLFQLSKAGIISDRIPTAEDEATIRLYEHHVHCDRKLLRIRISALSSRERAGIAYGHPSSWRRRVMELCRRHYVSLSLIRAARNGHLRTTDRLDAQDVALRVIDQLRLAGKLSSRWVRHGSPTPEMVAEIRRLARIVRDERRGRSRRWIADRKDL